MHDVQELPDGLNFEAGRITARFGVVAAAGFQAVPDVLIFHQRDLGLSSEELNVILNIWVHWYAPERTPFPSAKTIGKRMGVSERTVERYLTKLRRKKFLKKTWNGRKRTRTKKGHDLAPLIERLAPLAQERLQARQQRLRENKHVVGVNRGRGG
jgi:DNA-binding transcriptional regulator YhcF (GntR family)